MTYGEWGLDELMQFYIIGQPSMFVRREVLQKSGYLDLSYHYLLDHELWLRVAQQAPMRYIRQQWSAARYHAAAKNVSQTDKYGKDAYRIVEWMAKDPALAERYRRLRRKIWAGAYRLDAHYLLDGSRYGPALCAYLRSLCAYPPRALLDWRRILFAAVSLVFNIERVRAGFLKRRHEKLIARLAEKTQPEK